MILSFPHKGLRRLFEDDLAKGVNRDHVPRHAGGATNRGLEPADVSPSPVDRRSQGFLVDRRQRELARDFRFEDGAAHDIDLVDYHGKNADP
jgi:hypothetical protein